MSNRKKMAGAKKSRRGSDIEAHMLNAMRVGLKIIPVLPKSKKPALIGWPSKWFKSEADFLEHHADHPDANYGIVTGAVSRMWALDIDGDEGRKSLAGFVKRSGKLPITVRVITPNGQHAYFRHPGGVVPNPVGKIAPGIDVRGDRAFVVACGSINAEGVVYRYKKGRSPNDVKIASAPKWLLEELRSKNASPEPNASLTRLSTDRDKKRAERYIGAAVTRELERLSKAPESQRNATLNTCAFKLGQLMPYALVKEAGVIERLTEISHKIGLTDEEIPSTIRSGMEKGKKRPRQLFGGGQETQEDTDRKSDADGVDKLAESLSRLGETDVDNANRFVARHGADVLYSAGRGWLDWNGIHWATGADDRIQKRIIETMETISDEAAFLQQKADKDKRSQFCQHSKNKGAIDRTLGLAKAMLIVSEDKLDVSPDLLPVRNGTLNLKSGRLEPPDRRDLITHMIDITYDCTAKAPEFETYLRQATGNNVETAKFVQTAVGYTLTGHVREHVFFFLFGPHNSGKSTMLTLIGNLLGSYAQALPTEALLAKVYDSNIPNDTARLKGARFAAAVESNFNRQLDEAKIKRLTGGDRIPARLLHREWFDFFPQFKLWIAANDYPRVRASDSAMWGRIRAIPFASEVAEGKLDKLLPIKFKQEMPGILAWAVEGARNWYKSGLGTAAAVLSASAKWKESADVAKRFYQECLSPEPGQKVPVATMQARFKKWCSENGEKPLSPQEFFGSMMDLNLTQGRTGKVRYWRDVKLIK